LKIKEDIVMGDKIRMRAIIEDSNSSTITLTLVGDDGLQIPMGFRIDDIEPRNREELDKLIAKIIPSGYEYTKMSIDFYESDHDVPADKPYCSGWYETKKEIENRSPRIITTQMGLLSTRLIEVGYRVFVHPAKGEAYEISMDYFNTSTAKEIRPAHNLFRMWENGAFLANSVRK